MKNTKPHSNRALSLAALTAVSVAIAGCGTSHEPNAGPVEKTASVGHALASDDFRDWGTAATPELSPAGNEFTPYDESPALCANRYLISMIGVRRKSTGPSDKEYYFTTIQTYLNSEWGDFGTSSDVRFNSPPACTLLEAYPGGNFPGQFLAAGKDTSNKIRVLIGTEGGDPSASFEDPPPAPSPSVNGVASTWGTLGSNYTYSGTDGYPALATSGSRVVLTFRATDGGQQKIFAYNRYNGAWSGRLTAPSLPNGVVATGTPTITYITDATGTQFDNRFMIMTRTTAGELYWIMYNGATTWGTWSLGFTGRAVESDPALEWDPVQKFLTVYYRTTDPADNKPKIINNSAPNPWEIGVYPSWFIDPDETPTFYGAPRATYGGSVETAKRMVIFRGHTSSVPTEDRNKSIMYTQDIPSHYEPPESPWY